jgi:hypothetical protein
MRAFLFICLLAACVGCQSNKLTQYQPFAAYIGHDLTIKRTTYLWKEPFFVNFGTLDMTDISNPVFRDMTDVGPPIYHNGSMVIRSRNVKRVAILPLGTIVQVNQVLRYYDSESGGILFHAQGKAMLPDTNRKVIFDYIWGIGDTIDQAPWDNENVPAKRYVGFDGKSFKTQ